MPEAQPGIRVDIVSLEPIILLSAARKIADVELIEVSQPFYSPAWNSRKGSTTHSPTQGSGGLKICLAPFIPRDKKWSITLRNLHLLIGLMTGTNRYALRHRCELRIEVDQALKAQSK